MVHVAVAEVIAELDLRRHRVAQTPEALDETGFGLPAEKRHRVEPLEDAHLRRHVPLHRKPAGGHRSADFGELGQHPGFVERFHRPLVAIADEGIDRREWGGQADLETAAVGNRAVRHRRQEFPPRGDGFAREAEFAETEVLRTAARCETEGRRELVIALPRFRFDQRPLFGERAFLPGDPVRAHTGLAVRYALQTGAETLSRLAEYRGGVLQRNAADEMDAPAAHRHASTPAGRKIATRNRGPESRAVPIGVGGIGKRNSGAQHDVIISNPLRTSGPAARKRSRERPARSGWRSRRTPGRGPRRGRSRSLSFRPARRPS